VLLELPLSPLLLLSLLLELELPLSSPAKVVFHVVLALDELSVCVSSVGLIGSVAEIAPSSLLVVPDVVSDPLLVLCAPLVSAFVPLPLPSSLLHARSHPAATIPLDHRRRSIVPPVCVIGRTPRSRRRRAPSSATLGVASKPAARVPPRSVRA
jgi:hypothetical protein